jgi:hypothetical protein
VLLVVDEERQLALEHVERVGVLPVQVRVGAGAGVGEERLGDRELGQRRLEHDPAAEERLALAG